MAQSSDNSVITIDCHYLKPKFAASFLLVENGRAIFIENNTAHAVPILFKALEEQLITPDKVDYLIVTHAHLDHSGGTSALLSYCKNAKVIAHPKAIRTLVNPERLIQSAKRVYGEEPFEKLYGKIEPIPLSKLHSVQDGEILNWQNRNLTFFYTLGHASHHICIYDSKSEGVFTGDAFGLCYPELQNSGLFILPSTSPIDYEPIEAKKSIEKICSIDPKRLFLTHFGEVDQVKEAKKELLKNLDIHENQFQWAKNNLELGDELSHKIELRLKEIYSSFSDYLKLDLELNAQGIAFAAKRETNEK
jgi:glyoxylase-like metal-dependent hydrolase (beta-lactamase superfamily II)